MSELPYKTIVVTGRDAFDFLQAQLAADLREFDPDPVSAGPSLSAWCNPKGRVICLFRVSRVADGLELTLPDELAEAAVQRLQVFRFRAKVEFELEAATPARLGLTTDYPQWRLANLRAGIAEILARQSEEFTPHMLNLDLLGAVSVDKGCYPGQEIVARTHFRGATKRRTLRFESSAPVRVGARVSDGQRDIGEVLNAIGRDLLAVVPIDSVNQPLSVDDLDLRHIPLAYFG